MELRIGKKRFTVATLAEASAIYERERDASGEGFSTFRPGKIGRLHVSYNGRVWDGGKIVYDNRTAAMPSASF